MKNIFISGGGNAEVSKKFDQLYHNILQEKKRILYIPRAFYPERYPSCLERIDKVFPKSLGYTVDILDENVPFHTNELLHTYDGIYIGGGNTFRLLKLLKETGLIQTIQMFYEQGKPIYGGSAGAIILGKEIHTSPDINIEKLDFISSLGLNYFQGYAIFCHYQEKYDREIYDYIRNYEIPIIALPEGVGVYTHNDTYYVGGNDSAFIFTVQGKQAFNEELLLY